MSAEFLFRPQYNQDQRDDFFEYVDRVLEMNGGKPVACTAKTKVPRRSLDQNAFLWSLFTHVATQFNGWAPGNDYTKQDAHDYILDEVYGQEIKTIGKREVNQRRQTSKMNSAECANLITWILAWCAQRHCPPPLSDSEREWLEANRDG